VSRQNRVITDETLEALLRAPAGEFLATARRFGIPDKRASNLYASKWAIVMRHRLGIPRRIPVMSKTPVTDWLFGEHETPTPSGADRAVAGPDREGRWYSFCFHRIEGGSA
jgi:hypothetical protein